MEIITQESLASNFVQIILTELFEEYSRSGLNTDFENGSSFDEFVWNRMDELGRAAYDAIGEMYGDLDDAINEVM